jgi:hypothetical protein
MSKEIFRKSNNQMQRTLGSIMDCGNEYIVYDGIDYIGFNKDEYEIREVDNNSYYD